jgi:DNA-binding MarR family transcriptional regulator
MTPRKPDTASIAADAWRSIFDFIVGTSVQRIGILADLGLTPNDSRALGSLDPETGRTMRSLAEEWRCDASTATWIVDRLEAKGLAVRTAHPTDRRVTLVTLTTAGVTTRDEMLVRTYTPPPELLELDVEDLVALRDATARLPRVVGATPVDPAATVVRRIRTNEQPGALGNTETS